MNVTWSATGVRPETRVHLLRRDQLVDDRGRSAKQRPELRGLILTEVRDARHVPLRLQNQRSNSQGPNAVFDEPMLRLVNHASRQRKTALCEVARQTSLHEDPDYSGSDLGVALPRRRDLNVEAAPL